MKIGKNLDPNKDFLNPWRPDSGQFPYLRSGRLPDIFKLLNIAAPNNIVRARINPEFLKRLHDRLQVSTLPPAPLHPVFGDEPSSDILPIIANLAIPWIAITGSIVINTESALAQHLVPIDTGWAGFYFDNFLPEADDQVIIKDFNCFISRMDPMRQSWFYQLIRRGLLDQGFVSFNMHIDRIPALAGMTQSQAFEKQFQDGMTIFAPEHEIARAIVPYRNFDVELDLNKVILQSKFSIVIETYFDNNDIITYTEKIFRAMCLPRPWVLYSARHGVKYLREQGYDTLDDLVDHAQYDDLESCIDRQVAILNMAKELCSFDVEQHRTRLVQASNHNLAQIEKLNKNFGNTIYNAHPQVLDKYFALVDAAK
jgi:hypothetical protein